jgi:hypothetical protein
VNRQPNRLGLLFYDSQQQRLVIIGGVLAGKALNIAHNNSNYFLRRNGAVVGKRLKESILTVKLAV